MILWAMSESKWSDKGINFKIVSIGDYEKIKAFLLKAFFPDEPIFRSLKLMEGNGYIDKYVIKIIDSYMIKDALKESTSMAAFDENEEIVGLR